MELKCQVERKKHAKWCKTTQKIIVIIIISQQKY